MKEAIIQIDDFLKTSLLLRSLIEKLLDLSVQGITRISREKDKSTNYIDYYIEEVKYG